MITDRGPGKQRHPVGDPGHGGRRPVQRPRAVARALAEHPSQIAGMILEPVMMNAGIIPPGTATWPRFASCCTPRAPLLIFDEVKTGFTTGPGGVTALSGVTPTSSASPRPSAGDLGRRDRRHDGGDVADRRRRLRAGGHLQRQPLAMAATRANLSQVLTPDAYAHLDRLASRLRTALESTITEMGYPWRVVSVGARDASPSPGHRSANTATSRSTRTWANSTG